MNFALYTIAVFLLLGIAYFVIFILREYESLDQTEVKSHRDGRVLARVSQINAGAVKRDLLQRLMQYQRATGDPEARRLEAIHWAL